MFPSWRCCHRWVSVYGALVITCTSHLPLSMQCWQTSGHSSVSVIQRPLIGTDHWPVTSIVIDVTDCCLRVGLSCTVHYQSYLIPVTFGKHGGIVSLAFFSIFSSPKLGCAPIIPFWNVCVFVCMYSLFGVAQITEYWGVNLRTRALRAWIVVVTCVETYSEDSFNSVWPASLQRCSKYTRESIHYIGHSNFSVRLYASSTKIVLIKVRNVSIKIRNVLIKEIIDNKKLKLSPPI